LCISFGIRSPSLAQSTARQVTVTRKPCMAARTQGRAAATITCKSCLDAVAPHGENVPAQPLLTLEQRGAINRGSCSLLSLSSGKLFSMCVKFGTDGGALETILQNCTDVVPGEAAMQQADSSHFWGTSELCDVSKTCRIYLIIRQVVVQYNNVIPPVQTMGRIVFGKTPRCWTDENDRRGEKATHQVAGRRCYT
jgi:hypothetical protein